MEFQWMNESEIRTDGIDTNTAVRGGEDGRNSGITGMVADIQRFSLHDGPGIRTNIYLKGCNMHCAWCHNPETISFEEEIILDPDKCIGCGKCAEGCYSGARRPVGRRMTVDEIMGEALLDRDYYGDDGGITITGGEPFCQPALTEALLRRAAEEHVHAAVETNMSADWEILKRCLPLCESIMTDIKLWDEELHRQWTGISNERILSNIRRADALNVPLVIRTPVVCGVNDSEEEIGAIADFLSGFTSLYCYELLPYHPLGLSKHIEGKPDQQRFDKPDKARMKELADCAAGRGIPVRVANIRVS